MSTSNYDPRYLELWRDGGTKGVELKMGKAEAVALRHRLYRLRAAMKAENHPWYSAAERAAISILFTGSGSESWQAYSTDKQVERICAALGWKPEELEWKLSINAPDSRFDKILEGAGYKQDEPPGLD